MKALMGLVLFSIIFSGSFSNAAATKPCELTALKAGHYFALLNHDLPESRHLVVVRTDNESVDIAGDNVEGQRYSLRNPQGDLNYCSVLIIKQGENCVVREVSETDND